MADAVLLSVVMERTALSTQAGSDIPCLRAVVITPVPIGLVRIRISPGDGSGVCINAFRIDDACDRITEFHLGIANAMPAHHNASCLDHLR